MDERNEVLDDEDEIFDDEEEIALVIVGGPKCPKYIDFERPIRMAFGEVTMRIVGVVIEGFSYEYGHFIFGVTHVVAHPDEAQPKGLIKKHKATLSIPPRHIASVSF